MRNVEDLKCGDVFYFRDVTYLCLMCFTDNRHTQTIITAVKQPMEFPLKEVVALRLLRTFKVEVPFRLDIKISQLDNTRAELTEDMLKECERLQGK